MENLQLTPRKALNKAFLKVKPNRSSMERFKAGLTGLLERMDPAESEEFHKNLLSDFLKKTGFDPGWFINTKGRNDLVIHNGAGAKSPVGVIIEAKNPSNRAEMPSVDRLNVKAMQELLLYYLRERITHNNLELRHLIVTNVQEWFVFDARIFEQCFAADKELVRVFKSFDDGQLAGTKTDYFYKKIAPHYINAALDNLKFTYFNLRDYTPAARGMNKADDARLIPLLKLLSPEHLLKLPFTNDSNTLDRQFYAELLHIIGLAERKEKGKKLIERKPERERNAGSLLENAIIQLDSLDKLSRLEQPQRFGADKPERLFNIALELAITWTNRMLFLKLLEAQLTAYHKGDRSYAFLHKEKVGNYDDLNSLFFEVLARPPAERSAEMKERFGRVPYLNSSLFEPAAIEHAGLFISQIKDRRLPIHSATVLKDRTGRKRTGELDALEYFFAFLDAYDFTAEGGEEVQEENKTLINASVLGLIFEKINGYKDGSFFTPGFITMYMCRETIRRAVVQKFNQEKGWNCATLGEVADRIDDNAEANRIINSLRICDPAVGSGHFLVSALNELIALKSELGVLCDREGRRLKNIHVEVVNDELILTDEDGDFFEYKPKLPESQRVQEALFHEKQTLIENGLFGVDINPNSVKICRLRLWIELLKNAYYKAEDELETLPNIDINIKCGNSLISRFPLDSDLRQALKKGKWSIDGYRMAVMSYRNAETKEQKRAMEKLIDEIKGNFEAEIHANDPRMVRLRKERGRLVELTQQTQLFEMSKAEKAAWTKKVKTHTAAIEKLEAEIEAIKSNRIYENAFEWRFEFPEVLDNDGQFIGFDAVIGNPPYIRQEAFAEIKPYLKQSYRTFTGTADLYVYFIELGLRNLRQGGTFSFITPNKWMRATYGQPLRNFIKENRINAILDFGDLPVFEEATTYPCILSIDKTAPHPAFKAANITTLDFPAGLPAYVEETQMEVLCDALQEKGWTLSDSKSQKLMAKLRAVGKPLGEYINERFYRGVLTGFNEAFVIDRATRDRLIAEDPKSAEIIKPFLRGRDVKRWRVHFAEQYLIKIESSENKKHPWSGLDDKDAEKVFAKTYPSIHAWMDPFREQLISRCDQGKYFWELRACVYWHEFACPKIMYQEISTFHSFAWDDEENYANNKCFIIPSATRYLLGILNSPATWWFLGNIASKLQGGAYAMQMPAVSQIPIPPATPAQQTEIEERVSTILALKKENPEADVSALESEIDQLVYNLYSLTPDEIEIIEGARTTPTMTKSLLKQVILPELKQMGAYFSYDDVQEHLKKTGKEVPDATLKTYLSEFMESGFLFDAGKGWYSTLSKPFGLNISPLTKITKLLSDQFPLLEVSCWSTEQINPYMHHLLSRFTTMVYTAEDALAVVGDALRDAGYSVLVNPKKPDIEQYYTKLDNPVVIRPSLSKEPVAVAGTSPVEKLLVDLLWENKRLMFMEKSEAEGVVKNIVADGRLNMAALLSYAKRRDIELPV